MDGPALHKTRHSSHYEGFQDFLASDKACIAIAITDAGLLQSGLGGVGAGVYYGLFCESNETLIETCGFPGTKRVILDHIKVAAAVLAVT